MARVYNRILTTPRLQSVRPKHQSANCDDRRAAAIHSFTGTVSHR